MKKVREPDGTMRVTFKLPAVVHAERVAVCGDFNDWDETRHPMGRNPDGSFSLTVMLEPGRSYRFRYLLDGRRWENDWAADDYVPNAYGGQDSVVDV